MAKEIRQVEFAKEVDDAMVLVASILRDVREGKPVAEIAAGNLSGLVNAVAGIDQVPAEIEENRKVALQTIGYRFGEIADALLG